MGNTWNLGGILGTMSGGGGEKIKGQFGRREGEQRWNIAEYRQTTRGVWGHQVKKRLSLSNPIRRRRVNFGADI